MVNLPRTIAHVERNIGHVQEVIREIFLDDIALVAKAEDKIADAVAAVDLHDVPQNRTAADFHHRFWPHGGLFGQAGAESACENHCLHVLTRGSGRPAPGRASALPLCQK